MKRSRFTEQQAEQGTTVAEVIRKMGISEQTFYRWKKRYGGLMPSEVRVRYGYRRTPGRSSKDTFRKAQTPGGRRRVNR